MLALLIVIAAAAALTFTLPARPAIAIPGGMLATVAWWVAASASVGLMHGLAGVAYTALGFATGGYTVATGAQVARRERDRPDPQPERTGDLHPDSSRTVRHQIALDDHHETTGSAR